MFLTPDILIGFLQYNTQTLYTPLALEDLSMYKEVLPLQPDLGYLIQSYYKIQLTKLEVQMV
jgi:hypothetical protein